MEQKKSFEEIAEIVITQINSRRASWKLDAIDFEDVRQIIFTRVYQKYHTFDPKKGELSHWLSRLITRAMCTILRDNYLTYSRPCVQGCPFNTGGDGCGKTKSGIQCEECIIFREWKKKKESHFNVKQTLPLENHIIEVNSIQSDFIDIGQSKLIIDKLLQKRLTEEEYNVYKLIYVEGKTEKEAAESMGYKKQGGKMWNGYGIIRKFKKKYIEEVKKIIEEEDLAV